MDYVWDANIDYFIPYRLDEPSSNTDELDKPVSDTYKLDMVPENISQVKIIYGGGGLTKSWHRGCSPKEVIEGVAGAFGFEVLKVKQKIEPLGNSEQLEREA